MNLDLSPEAIRTFGQDLLLAGAAVMAIWYGLRRVYRMARNVETLVSSVADDRKEREALASTLKSHIDEEEERNAKTEDVIQELMIGQREILREIRPNGGSSIKDVVNQVQRDVAVLTQWKDDVNHPSRRP